MYMYKMGRGGFKIGVFLLLLLALLVATMEAMSGTEPAKEVKAGGEGSGTKAGEAAVHIVYMENPKEEEAEAYHVRTLTTVLGSEEAAKQALLYSYKTVASGFSAKLTPEQAAEISKQPGVLQVVLSEMYHLHKGNAPH